MTKEKTEKEWLQELIDDCKMTIKKYVNGSIQPEWLQDFCENRMSKLELADGLVENNATRFAGHLGKIADVLGLEWTDGDFPIEECIDAIKLESIL